MEEQRASYRQDRGLQAIRVYLGWSGHDPVEGSLIDISARGAAVALAVPLTQAVGLEVGASVSLTFEIPGVAGRPTLSAVIRNEREDANRCVVGLEISDRRALQDSLPASVFSVFNRRRHYRVNLPEEPGLPVSAWRMEADRPVTGLMTDISGGGCSLLFEPGEAPEPGQALRIAFSLPGSEHELRVACKVRTAFAHHHRVQCGVEFDEGGSEDFAAQQTRIVEYVMRRRRELRRGM